MAKSSDKKQPSAPFGMKPKKWHRLKKVAGTVGRSLLTLFLVFIIAGCLISGAVALYIVKFVTPQKINLSQASLQGTSILYNNDPKTGQPVEMTRVNGGQNRIWVPLSQMPDNLKNAFISTEDQRFYEHEGVDWKRTAGAFANLFFHFYSSAQGGSTITQQLVNNLTSAGKGVNYGRKVQEIVNALDLEKRYSKDQIIEAYLNTINLNEGCYGVEAASKTYFGKDVKDLDISQCAVLATMPKAPNTYDPFKHPDKTKERQKLVLKNMYEQKKITKQQYEDALKEPLALAARQQTKQATRSWFTDMVITDVQSDLEKQYGYSADYALNMIYTKGLRIYTTMNPTVQNAMDKVYQDTTNSDYWFTYPGQVQPQSAMMVVDYSGQIAGVEGGRGAKAGNLVLNRATSSMRQPGSSIKPLGVYAPAMDINKITWSTVVSKSQLTNVPGRSGPWPSNDEPGTYTGSMSIVDALAQSVNTVAVHVESQYLSPDYTFNFLKDKLNFTSLVNNKTINGKVYSDKTLSIAIGALTNGATVREMAGGYEIFGNGGKYYKPYSYTQVQDSQGNVILQNKPSATQAVGADTSFIMNQLLQQDVTRSGATGLRAQIPNCPVGGKTGTTNEHKDRWFAGITPDFVGVVWLGYDIPKDIAYYNTRTNPSLQAWKSVMETVQQSMPKKNFPTNGSVVQENYDPYTGNVTPGGSESGWFKTSNIPTSPVPSSTQ